MKNLQIFLASIVVIAFATLGIHNIITKQNKSQLKGIQLKSKSTELKELNLEYDILNKEIDKASKSQDFTQEQINKFNLKKDELDKKKKELEKELQAKIDAKTKEDQALAVASSKIINTLTNTQPASASGGDVMSIIKNAAEKYGLDYGHFSYIAKCESTYNPLARNPNPVVVRGVNYGHAEGLYQFIPSTWERMSSQAGFAGASVTDAYANANVAAWAWANGHSGEWQCQ